MPGSDQDNVASVADLIAQFKTAQSQLFGLIDEDRVERLTSFQQRSAQLFSLIERRKPVDVREFQTIAHFYLDLLEDDDDGYNKRLFDCLRQLIVRHAANGSVGHKPIDGGRA